jgi:hypothetical protein
MWFSLKLDIEMIDARLQYFLLDDIIEGSDQVLQKVIWKHLMLVLAHRYHH